MNHILKLDGYFDKELCREIIKRFESAPNEIKFEGKSGGNKKNKKSLDISFLDGSMIKSDEAVKYANGVTNHFSKDGLLDEINLTLLDGLGEYYSKYPYLNTLSPTRIEAYNIQKYNPNEGFYDWHCENSGTNSEYPEQINRVLAFMVYLNDVEDGGTEFLEQNLLVGAEEGRMLIWPAFFTHTHKGQISTTKTKYILTGWVRYCELNSESNNQTPKYNNTRAGRAKRIIDKSKYEVI